MRETKDSPERPASARKLGALSKRLGIADLERYFAKKGGSTCRGLVVCIQESALGWGSFHPAGRNQRLHGCFLYLGSELRQYPCT